VILAVPFQSAEGTIVNESPEIKTATAVVSLVALNVKSSSSTSVASKISTNAVSSDVSCNPISVSTGASFSEVTVTDRLNISL
jgi:hypothetical protein